MRFVSSLRTLALRHPDVAEGLLGLVTAAVVVGVALVQFGATADGWARGISLGAVTGAGVALVYRRRRRTEEDREREQARQRLELARELHDAVSGQVAVIGVQAAAARRVMASRPDEAAVALERIELASRTAIGDLRRLLVTLRSEPGGADAERISDPEPGLAQLPDLLAQVRASGLLVGTVAIDPAAASLPAALDHVVFRIIQEALTNALRHAGRVATTVTVRCDDARLLVSVRNEAPATRPVGRTEGAGLGLVGMRERVKLFDGRLETRPTEDGGYLVDATFPLLGPHEP